MYKRPGLSHIINVELQIHKAGRNSGPTFPKVRLFLGKKKGKTQLPQNGNFIISVPKHLIIGSPFGPICHQHGVIWSCTELHIEIYIIPYEVRIRYKVIQSHGEFLKRRSSVTGFTFSRSTAIFIATTPSSSAYQESTKTESNIKLSQTKQPMLTYILTSFGYLSIYIIRTLYIVSNYTISLRSYFHTKDQTRDF